MLCRCFPLYNAGIHLKCKYIPYSTFINYCHALHLLYLITVLIYDPCTTDAIWQGIQPAHYTCIYCYSRDDILQRTRRGFLTRLWSNAHVTTAEYTYRRIFIKISSTGKPIITTISKPLFTILYVYLPRIFDIMNSCAQLLGLAPDDHTLHH